LGHFLHLFKNIVVANAFISPFNTQTMYIKSFCTQLYTLAGPPGHPGLLIPEADAMSTAPRRQGIFLHLALTS
jgi:hypothetical protein